MKKKGDLKKQSQFLKVQNDVNSVIVEDYGDLTGWKQRKTNPIQSQLWATSYSKRGRKEKGGQ